MELKPGSLKSEGAAVVVVSTDPSVSAQGVLVVLVVGPSVKLAAPRTKSFVVARNHQLQISGDRR